MINDPTYWQNALSGDFGPVHENEYHYGFYRMRFRKDETLLPVAIYQSEDGNWYAQVDRKNIDPGKIWTFCCNKPVSYDAYLAALDGKGWPEDPPALPEAPAELGHNLPTDPNEALKVEFAGEKELAEGFLKTQITTQEQADQAAVWSKKLSDIHGKADKLFRSEKDPINEQGKAIDDKYRWRGDAKELATKLKRALDKFLADQAKAEEERARKAREDADRIKREAEAAKQKAREAEEQSEEAATAAKAEASRLAREAEEADRASALRRVSSGRTGARVSLRTYTSGEITDIEKLLIALKDTPEVRELAQTLANREARAGNQIPGMKIVTEQRAA